MERLKVEQQDLKDKVEKYQNLIAQENKIARHFSLQYRFMDDLQKDNFPLFKEHLRSYKEQIDNYEKIIRDRIAKINLDNQILKKELLEKQSALSEIEKGKNKYDEKTTRLISVIKNELYKKYKKEIDVRPLCEYLEITDEHWTNALEGYLNTQRFALIIATLRGTLSLPGR